MDSAPLFDRPDLFDGRRIQLADIDGSGTADIIYSGSNSVQLYFNQSGNGWATARVLGHFPPVDSASRATALDLLGNGTACLVWSSPLPGNAGRPMRYIDLMGGQKPHLLVSETNNLGATSVIHYAPSTKFYVGDKLAGKPWVTRLPFPVQVVEGVETYNYVSRNLFVTRYAYHDGYYDGVEREFRGFGHVDQWDTEAYATLTSSPDIPAPANLDATSDMPPVLTKTWFHTGAYFGEAAVSAYMQGEYYAEGDPSTDVAGLTSAQLSNLLLDDTILPATMLLPDGTRLAYTLSPEESGRPAARCAGRCYGRRSMRWTVPPRRTARTACRSAITPSRRCSPGARTSTGSSSSTRARRSTSVTSAGSIQWQAARSWHRAGPPPLWRRPTRG